MAAKRRLPHRGGIPTPGHRIQHGRGFEVFHEPSPMARKFWYHLRTIGKADAPATFHYEHHGLDGFLLHFVTKGKLWHRIRERMHLAHRGEACLMDLREDVSYGTAGPGKAEFYWVLFNARDMPAVFLELRADREPIFAKLNAARTEALFRGLISLTERTPPAYEVTMSSLLTALLAVFFACRDYPISLASVADRDRPFSPAVRIAIDRIITAYDEPLFSVKKLAARLNQSVHYFIRRFHREVGLSPKSYLTHYRIERAKSQLETSDHSVEQIARSVGFRDPAYFARQFRKIGGMSPREYRRIHQTRA